MRLKSIYIKGFKSFAQETTIYFNQSITGIVGPNGSGKSNIIDAIRWVLGEQKSSELRLAKMQDVIFNGTKNKRKSKYTEVAITFENTRGILPSEYNFVKISRLLYQSGESEYRLNDTTCRMKDIKNLLIDTGIGSNSYAIIELAMVDDILQDKDHARRRMFEQAAGISKYKKRKKETLNKLSLTQTDLDRVEDLLHEIAINLKALEKQARRSKKYLKLKENYRQSSLLYHQVKINHLLEDKKSLQEKIDAEKVDLVTLSKRIDQLEAQLQKDKLKNLNDEKQLNLFQQKIGTISDDIRSLESRKGMLESKLEYAQNILKSASEKVTDLEIKITQTKEKELRSISMLEKAKDNTSMSLKMFEESDAFYQEVKTKFEKNKTVAEQIASEKSKLEQNLHEVEKRLVLSENKIQQFNNTIRHLHETIELDKKSIQEQELFVANLENTVHEIQQRLDRQQKSEKSKEVKKESLSNQIQEFHNLLRNELRKLDIKENEIKLLHSIINNLEGFPESMKYLNKNWKADFKLLSDVISVDEDYKIAVEAFLAPYLNYFIVHNTKEAQEAIQLLLQSKKGRAQFFILEHVVENDGNNLTPVGIPIIDVIEAKEEFQELLSTICGNACIVDELPKTIQKDVTFVKKDGTEIVRNHQMNGGALDIFENDKIGRKDNLKRLQNQKTKLQQSIVELKNSIEKAENEKDKLSNSKLIEDIEENRIELQKEQQKLYSEKAKLESLQKVVIDQQVKLESNQKNLAHEEKLEKESLQRKDSILSLLESERFESNNGMPLSALSEELSHISSKRNEAQIKHLQDENHQSNLTKDVEQLREKIVQLEQDKQSLVDSQKKESENQDQYIAELASLKKDLQSKYQVRKAESENLGGVEHEYFEAKQKISDQEQNISLLQKSFNEKQSKINRLIDKEKDISYKIDGVKQRISIEFNTNIQKIDITIPDDYQLHAEELNIDKLRNRIANFGEVNPMAIQAYEEMEKRMEDMANQRDDILDAKDKLVETIQEIETTATNMFLESFEEIRRHFKKVFRSLFTEDDQCDLILENSEDPLNSDIDIIAKPKGKRPQSLSQLSGGEKTLTASALLFSLYLLKPAPFCVFDEVDAPLDDQNVNKFTNIIQAFSDQSQFIVVTHNKATMAELDVLYGVYMEEKGVSSISAVDFRNFDHNPILQQAVG